ncbi:flagellar hook-length control protein FliK [Keratinibaculum paraultunense]|uniref:Flagellar hook-length control protein FliK n=1 Tax=Keratinibaculum paraultunense TaxID=1278232 RepID=A0A4R3KXL7_9FIRM|nr:flagellar hook-length control protein FliK [Keratinibaculum paraultunense]QQY80734.1 flagellar hook-length control protein FliK [Keratinibaculum paraultunense]TCS89658.1 flagellar hook-length control protein FliK [Keratinibaculum paraultunense]
MLNVNSILEDIKTSNGNFSAIKSAKKNQENFAKKFEKYIKEQNEIGNINKQYKGSSKKTKFKNGITKKHIQDELPTDKRNKNKGEEVKDELLVLISSLLKLIEELDDLEIKNISSEFDLLKFQNINFQDVKNIKIEHLLDNLLLEDLTLNEVIELIENIEALLPKIKNNTEEKLIIESIYDTLEEILSKFKDAIKKDDFANLDRQIFTRRDLEDNNIKNNNDIKNSNSNKNIEELEDIDDLMIGSTMEDYFDIQEDKIRSTELLKKEFVSEDEAVIADEMLIVNEQEVVGEQPEFNNEFKNDYNNLIFGIINEKFDSENIESNEQKLQQVDYKDIFKQIVDKVKVNLENSKQEVKIKLKPEILGDLLLKMEMEKGSILAKIMVDNYKTKDIIEANLYQLKEDMRENGLEIKAFEVFVGTNEDFKRESDLDFNSNKKQNKSSTKLKIKNKELIEKETYLQNTLPIINEKGSINLLA